MNEIDRYIENIVNEFKMLSFDEVDNKSKAEKLLFLYAYYHYFNADSSKIADIMQGNIFNARAWDKIAGIYIDQDSDFEDVDVIISIYSTDNTFDIASVLKIFNQVETLICEKGLQSGNIRQELLQFLNEEEYNVSQVKPLKIRLITNYTPKTISEKRIFANIIQSMKPIHTYVSYHISFGQDIEYEVIEVENPKEYVSEAIFQIDKPNNYVCFGEEQSLVVNISARSLKQIYENYGYRGLFAQNLRYYVKNTKIDGKVVETIREHPENFWYYNNGIILICDDYHFIGNTIRVRNFSIINGGQTTKLIGETAFDQDFFIQCRIIRNKYEEVDEKVEFISNVAEATNTQKPIRDKDLVANRVEQRLLKKQLADAGIYCQIKRGEKINKRIYPNAWQNTTNEEIGQFLLAFVYQKPGIARSSKASILGNKDRYNLLFNKKYDSEFLGDLLKIKAFYKQWMNKVKKTNDNSDQYKEGLVNNGMLFMTAIIGVICKIFYRSEIIEQIAEASTSEQKIKIVAQHDISHPIFRRDCVDKEIFYTLFEYCYNKFYRPGYELLKTFKPRFNYYSNFTKASTNYDSYVFKQIEFEYRKGISLEDMGFLEGIFYAATEEEKQRSLALLDRYANTVDVSVNRQVNVSSSVSSKINDALVEYRTAKYKQEKVFAYEVFTNKACDKISKFAPITLEDLNDLRCLDKNQIACYGNDIINIVKQYVL